MKAYHWTTNSKPYRQFLLQFWRDTRTGTTCQAFSEFAAGCRQRSRTSGNCIKIRDLSASGAGLEVADAAELPAEFDLLIIDDCLLFRVQVRWRHSDRLGVEFVSVPHKVLSAL